MHKGDGEERERRRKKRDARRERSEKGERTTRINRGEVRRGSRDGEMTVGRGGIGQ